MRHSVIHPLGILAAAALWAYPNSAFAFELSPPTQLPGLGVKTSALLPDAIEPMRLELNLSSRTLTLYRNEKVHKRYPVAVGRSGWETPTGTFRIENMRRDPEWMNPFTGEVIPGGAWDNPLGRRWIGFWTDGRDWVGFHGTNSTDSIGSAASHGCVRMFEHHIEEVYELVALGATVKVTR